MTFAGLNPWAILAAACTGWVFGAVYYIFLGERWLAAIGSSRENYLGPEGRLSPRPFIVSFLAQLVMAWVLAGIVGHLGEVSLRVGAISALFVWTGFVATVLATSYGFQQRRLALLAIDAGHWLGVLVIQGSLIGLLGA